MRPFFSDVIGLFFASPRYVIELKTLNILPPNLQCFPVCFHGEKLVIIFNTVLALRLRHTAKLKEVDTVNSLGPNVNFPNTHGFQQSEPPRLLQGY